MTKHDKIDFSSLDPSLDEDRWDARVRETVEQAMLLRKQREDGIALTGLDPFRRDSALERRLGNILGAVASVNDGTAASEMAATGEASGAVIASEYALPLQLAQAAPRTWTVGALLAAAVWLAVLWGGGGHADQKTGPQGSPGLSLATWAQQGQVPQTEAILTMMESNHVRP